MKIELINTLNRFYFKYTQDERELRFHIAGGRAICVDRLINGDIIEKQWISTNESYKKCLDWLIKGYDTCSYCKEILEYCYCEE